MIELDFNYLKHTLDFKFDAGTSRGVLKKKAIFLIFLKDKNSQKTGVGECAPLKGLSIDDIPKFEEILQKYGIHFTKIPDFISEQEVYKFVEDIVPDAYPAIRFGFEVALMDLMNGGRRIIYQNDFVVGNQALAINGLVWMGDESFMLKQIKEKLQKGFQCVKIKIGAIDFEKECELIAYIRQRYSKNEVTIRVDANGAFTYEEAIEKLGILAKLDIHSIEQPIQQGQVEKMARLCEKKILPIALDEELIGIYGADRKVLLERIQPDYIILKPTLLGGLAHTKVWIDLANQLNIGWWITSALESNIGLNAICQFTANYPVVIPQGLGTGQLYHNNFQAPLVIKKGEIIYDTNKKWDFGKIRD